MRSSGRADRIPLTGADAFLRAVDAEVARWNGAGHLSQLVLRLGPGFEPGALRELVTRVAEAAPIVRAPMRRPWAVAPPVYRLDLARRNPPPGVSVHPAEPDDGSLPAVFFARMNERFDLRRGRLLHFDVVPRGERSDVAMTWAHALFDGAGSEEFVTWLERCHRGERKPEELADDPGLATAPPLRSFRERGDLARAWQRRFRRFAEHPVHSLGGPLRRVRQRLRYELVTLDPHTTAHAVARARAKAGFLTPMLFYLAAAMRAHQAVHRARGSDPGSHFLPLPVNLRPKGSPPAVFRSHVSMMWFQALPAVADDLDALLDALKAQRRDWIRDGLIEAGAAAMDLARFAPARLYTRMSRREFAGELSSFFFAFTDEFVEDSETFLGAPIENGFHAPPVTPSPGSGVILCLRRGRLNAALVHQEGVFRPGELARLRDALLADLTGD